MMRSIHSRVLHVAYPNVKSKVTSSILAAVSPTSASACTLSSSVAYFRLALEIWGRVMGVAAAVVGAGDGGKEAEVIVDAGDADREDGGGSASSGAESPLTDSILDVGVDDLDGECSAAWSAGTSPPC
jgi:hypothetical protein